MKRLTQILVAGNLLLVLGILSALCFAEPKEQRLFRVSPTNKPPTDQEAIEAWWRDEFGDGGPKIKILEMKPRMKANDFEIKHDAGGPLGPYWINCAEYLNRFKGATNDRDSALYKLRDGADGAVTLQAKLKTDGSSAWQELFVINRGEVIFSTRAFKAAR